MIGNDHFQLAALAGREILVQKRQPSARQRIGGIGLHPSPAHLHRRQQIGMSIRIFFIHAVRRSRGTFGEQVSDGREFGRRQHRRRLPQLPQRIFVEML